MGQRQVCKQPSQPHAPCLAHPGSGPHLHARAHVVQVLPPALTQAKRPRPGDRHTSVLLLCSAAWRLRLGSPHRCRAAILLQLGRPLAAPNGVRLLLRGQRLHLRCCQGDPLLRVLPAVLTALLVQREDVHGICGAGEGQQ